MPQIINTNIASLTAQRNLNSSQNSLNTSLQRLSSGLRINSAKDDAAGLAISERFTTQIRGLNQASRNANDAISLSQTAEGALGEIGNNLQRIRELAVQSANATNSSSDRAALDLEVQQRLAEVDRIASQTSFNGQKILDGTFGTANFQVGANVGETISLDLSTSTRIDKIGETATATSVDLGGLITPAGDAVAGSYESGNLSSLDFSQDATGGTATFAASDLIADFSVTNKDLAFNVSNGTTTSQVTLTANLASLSDVQTAIDDDLGTEFVVSNDGTNIIITSALEGEGTSVVLDSPLEGSAGAAASIPTETSADGTFASALAFEVDGDAVSITDNYTGNIQALVNDISSQLTTGEYTVSVVDSDSFSIISNTAGTTNNTYLGVVDTFADTSITGAEVNALVPASDGSGAIPVVVSDLTIQLGTSDAVTVTSGSYSTAQSLVDEMNTALAGNATVTLNDDGTATINANDAVTIGGSDQGTFFASASYALDGDLTEASVTTVGGAETAIRQVDSALGSISDLRSTFGAIQNRFESTISNLSTAVESLSAARSRIQDADFASETAALTRAQILQQAGVSILSQANSLPQSVLGLLQ